MEPFDDDEPSAVLGFNFLNESFMLVQLRLADNTLEMKVPELNTSSGDPKRICVRTAGAVAPQTHQGGWGIYFPQYDWHIACGMPGEVTSDCANGTAILRALQCVVRQGLTCTEFTLQYANATAIHEYLQSFLESRLPYNEDTKWKELKKNQASTKAVLRECVAEVRKLELRQPDIKVKLRKTKNILEAYDIAEQATTEPLSMPWGPQDVQPHVPTTSWMIGPGGSSEGTGYAAPAQCLPDGLFLCRA
jgi:ribonuclease HI